MGVRFVTKLLETPKRVLLYLIASRHLGRRSSRVEKFSRAAVERRFGNEYPDKPRWVGESCCVLEKINSMGRLHAQHESHLRVAQL